jgi:hypothetical protein
LITQPRATLDERAQNEHHCRLGLQPRAPAPHYGPEFLPRFTHESYDPTLASNPLRNSRSELVATMSRACFLPARSVNWPGPDRNAVPRPRFYSNRFATANRMKNEGAPRMRFSGMAESIGRCVITSCKPSVPAEPLWFHPSGAFRLPERRCPDRHETPSASMQQIRVNFKGASHLGHRCPSIQPLNGRHLYFLRELPSRQCHESILHSLNFDS